MAELDFSGNFTNVTTSSVTTALPSFDISTSALDNITMAIEKDEDTCSPAVPTTQEMFDEIGTAALVLLIIVCIVSAITVALFLEAAVFIVRNYKRALRIRKVMSILSIYPTISLCSLTALLVPKSSVITDFVSAVSLSNCLYQFMILLVDYYGGLDIMLVAISNHKFMLRSPPCCCCCLCLPSIPATRQHLNAMRGLILQAAVLRPILMFIAAVMWSNGTYRPGEISDLNIFHASLNESMHSDGQLDPKAVYTYISVINTVSSLFAMYGCVQLLRVCSPTLETFFIRGKLLALQAVIIFSGMLSLLASILVATGAIPCRSPFTTKARAERLANMLLIFLMCPISLLGRKHYRHKAEGSKTYKLSDGPHFSRSEDEPVAIYRPGDDQDIQVVDKRDNNTNHERPSMSDLDLWRTTEPLSVV